MLRNAKKNTAFLGPAVRQMSSKQLEAEATLYSRYKLISQMHLASLHCRDACDFGSARWSTRVDNMSAVSPLRLFIDSGLRRAGDKNSPDRVFYALSRSRICFCCMRMKKYIIPLLRDTFGNLAMEGTKTRRSVQGVTLGLFFLDRYNLVIVDT